MGMTMRRWVLFAVMLSVVLLPCSQSLAADDYPSKPVQIVVPFAAGGNLDLFTRILAKKLKEYLKQPVLVLNKPGAGNALGAAFVATSKPDGYTLYASSGATFGFIHALNRSFTFGLKDFAPIAAVGSFPSVFAVHKDVPVKTLPELLDYADKNPGKLTYCSTGFGGLNHLEFEMLKLLVKQKLDIPHVPQPGVAPALTALMGNQVQVATLPYSNLLKKNNGKLIRIIAVERPKRLPSIPDVSTTGEQGFAKLDTNNYYLNYLAPAGTPAAIIAKLEEAFLKTARDKEVIKSLEQLDIQPDVMNSKELRAWLEAQIRKFEGVIEQAHIVAK